VAQGTMIGRGYIAVSVDEGGARAALGAFVSFAGSAFKRAVAGAALVTGAAAKMGIGFLAMRENAAIAFTTLLGSGQKAESFLQNLQQFAAKTPFELPGLINNARMLLGVGMAAKDVVPTLQSLGDAAGALGIDQEKFNNILLATTQAMGKGKLQGEELMQMVENGIPVWQLLSKATGKPVGELQKLSSAGKLLSAETLPKLFAQMSKDYGGAMAAQSQTLTGQWSSLKDNTQILLGTAMKPLFNEIKKGTGYLGELVGSDQANAWAEKFAAGMERGFEAAHVFGSNLKSEFAPAVDEALGKTRDRFAELWPSIKSGASNALEILVNLGSKALPPLIELAHAGGGLLKAALEALDRVLSAVAANSDAIGDAIANAAQVAGAIATPAVKLLGVGLQLLAEVLERVVYLVGDLSGPLGAMTGVVVGGVAAWKLLGGTILGAGGAINKLRPSKVAEQLQPVADRIGEVAERAGVMTWQLTGSATAGHKVVTAGRTIGGVLSKVGSALPVVGIAAVGVGMAFEATAAQTDELTNKLLEGGGAAAQAKTQIEGLRTMSEAGGFAGFVADVTGLGDAWSDTANDAEAAAKKQIASMTNTERASLAVRDAQFAYDQAVKQFGESSPQAIAAQQGLATATNAAKQADTDAADASRDRAQAILDLANQALAAANADVALRQSALAVEQAEKAAAEATRKHGKNSTEAKQANLQLEQAYINAANAAVLKAQKDNAGKSASQQAAAASNAYRDKLLEMVNAAGVKAPASLLKLVDGLSDSELAAYNAAMKTSGFKTQVVTLPSGRTVRVAANTAQAQAALKATKAKLDAIRNKVVDVHVNVHGNAMAAAGLPTGGFQRERAVGGPIQPNVPYLVGENGPEIITPNSGGFVHNARATANILAGAAAGGPAGINLSQVINQLPGENIDQLADRVAQKIAWRVT
jgi:tape measure domain-containing protein